MAKASDEDKDYFRSVLPDRPEIVVKPMFGSLGAFVNGNMFAGLYGGLVGVKLDETGRAELQEIDGTGQFGPVERPMGGYLALPAAWRDQPEQATEWTERALDYVAGFAPKPPKQARKG